MDRLLYYPIGAVLIAWAAADYFLDCLRGPRKLAQPHIGRQQFSPEDDPLFHAWQPSEAEWNGFLVDPLNYLAEKPLKH